MREKGKESVGNVKLDLRFLMVEMLYLIIIFNLTLIKLKSTPFFYQSSKRNMIFPEELRISIALNN